MSDGRAVCRQQNSLHYSASACEHGTPGSAMFGAVAKNSPAYTFRSTMVPGLLLATELRDHCTERDLVNHDALPLC